MSYMSATNAVPQPYDCDYQVESGVFTPDVHGYTDRLLQKLTNLGRAAAYPPREESSERSGFGGMNFCFVGCPRSGGRNNNNNAVLLVCAIVMAVVGVVLYVVWTKKNEDLQEQIADLAKANLNHWQYTKQGFASAPGIAEKIQNTVDLGNQILNRQSNDTTMKICLIAAHLLVGAAAIGVGVVCVIPVLSAVGVTLGVCALGFGIFTAITNEMSKRADRKDGLAMLNNIYELTGDYPVRFRVLVQFNVQLNVVIPDAYYLETHRQPLVVVNNYY